MAKARPQSHSAKTAKKPAAPKPAPKAARKKTSAKKPKKAAAPAAAPKEERNVFGVEVEAGSVDKTLAKVREELTHWVNKGRYTKVRFMLRGKPILPDLPVAAVVAAEAVTFWWAGLLRALLVTLGAGTILSVELVNDADREVGHGRQCLLAGDLDKAMESFKKALQMDRDNPAALLSMGIAFKLRGDLAKAREFLQKTEQADPEGSSGQEAARMLDQMNAAAPTSTAQ
ncbi:MAG TPA: tetratricopeptide repeat protein [Myxococcales bacterium]